MTRLPFASILFTLTVSPIYSLLAQVDPGITTPAAHLTRVAALPFPADAASGGSGIFSASGKLAIFTGKAPFLVYDSALKGFVQVGRQGEGPGEFNRISSPMWVGDSLLVVDGAVSRVTVFAAGTKLAGTFSASDWGRNVSPMFMKPDGSGVFQKHSSSSTLKPDTISIFMKSAVAGQADAPILQRGLGRFGFYLKIGTTLMQSTSLFNTFPKFVYLPAEAAVVVAEVRSTSVPAQASLEIASHPVSGGQTSVRRVTIPVTARTKADRGKFVGDLAQSFVDGLKGRGGMVDMDDLKAQIDTQLVYPPFTPPLESVRVDRSGQLWLHLLRPAKASGVLCRVPSSLPLQCAELPQGAIIIAIEFGGRVILNIPDADGVPALAEYRFR